MLSGHFCAKWFPLKSLMCKCVKLILEPLWVKPLHGCSGWYYHPSPLGGLSRKKVEVVKKVSTDCETSWHINFIVDRSMGARRV